MLIQIPWPAGKCMTWEVTITNTLAGCVVSTYHILNCWSCRCMRTQQTGRSGLVVSSPDTFIPLAFEMLRPINQRAQIFNQLEQVI